MACAVPGLAWPVLCCAVLCRAVLCFAVPFRQACKQAVSTAVTCLMHKLFCTDSILGSLSLAD